MIKHRSIFRWPLIQLVQCSCQFLYHYMCISLHHSVAEQHFRQYSTKIVRIFFLFLSPKFIYEICRWLENGIHSWFRRIFATKWKLQFHRSSTLQFMWMQVGKQNFSTHSIEKNSARKKKITLNDFRFEWNQIQIVRIVAATMQKLDL